MEIRKNVLVHCCNRLLRESVARILSKKIEFYVITSQTVDSHTKPDIAGAKAHVVVLDSLDLLAEIPILEPQQRSDRSVKCVLVAMEDSQQSFLTAIKLGALGYVLQDASSVEVVSAIRLVVQGEAVCPAAYVRFLYDYFLCRSTGAPNDRTRAQLGLTRREQQLIPLIHSGLTNKEIASHFNLSEQTIKNHVHRILRKVGVETRLNVAEAFQTQTLRL
jgi:DNA-binding NarL/FixJ family response regulator